MGVPLSSRYHKINTISSFISCVLMLQGRYTVSPIKASICAGTASKRRNNLLIIYKCCEMGKMQCIFIHNKKVQLVFSQRFKNERFLQNFECFVANQDFMYIL